MKMKRYLPEDFGSVALRYTMWLAIAGFVLMVGVAVINSGAS